MIQLNLKNALVLFSVMVFLSIGFTNCTRKVSFQTTHSKVASDGGGDGYSGKLYARLNLDGNCSDGEPFSDQIQFANVNQPYLIRKACQSIDPMPVEVLVSPIDNNYLSFGLQVFRQKSNFNIFPQAPAILAAMSMTSSNPTNHVCNGADCWKFEGNGSIFSDVDFSASGEYEFVIMARSDLAFDVGADLKFEIDGIAVGVVTVNSTSDAEYALKANVSPGRHRVSLSFLNDYEDQTENRNLYATSIRIKSNSSANSACLNRSAGNLVTLTSSQVPYLNKNLPAQSKFDARSVDFQGTTLRPMRLAGGEDACLSGGRISGSWPASAPWSAMSGSWGISINSPNFLLENFQVKNYGDCIGIWDNANGFQLSGANCSDIRGDFVSNKNSWSGTIEDSFFDGGSTFFNDRDSAPALSGATTTIRNNLVRLQSFNDNFYGTPGHGWFWKQDSATSAVKLRLHGNVFMAEQAPVTNEQFLNPQTILSCKKSDGSPDNIIVWLGTGPYPRPEELATGCFRLTTDRNVWTQAVTEWQSRH